MYKRRYWRKYIDLWIVCCISGCIVGITWYYRSRVIKFVLHLNDSTLVNKISTLTYPSYFIPYSVYHSYFFQNKGTPPHTYTYMPSQHIARYIPTHIPIHISTTISTYMSTHVPILFQIYIFLHISTYLYTYLHIHPYTCLITHPCTFHNVPLYIKNDTQDQFLETFNDEVVWSDNPTQ